MADDVLIETSRGSKGEVKSLDRRPNSMQKITGRQNPRIGQNTTTFYQTLSLDTVVAFEPAGFPLIGGILRDRADRLVYPQTMESSGKSASKDRSQPAKTSYPGIRIARTICVDRSISGAPASPCSYDLVQPWGGLVAICAATPTATPSLKPPEA